MDMRLWPRPAHTSGAATGGRPERRPGRGCGPKTLLPDGVSRLTLTARCKAVRMWLKTTNPGPAAPGGGRGR